MILNSTTDSLEIVLDKNLSSSGVSYVISYVEYSNSGLTPYSNFGSITGTTPQNLISSPSSGLQRQLKWGSINNEDSSDVGVTIRFNNNNTYYNNAIIYLRTGETFQYSEDVGWKIYDNKGSERTVGFSRLPNGVRMCNNIGLNNITTTLSISNTGTTYCTYLGRAERNFSSVKVQYRITTQITNTISWAELGIYRGEINLATNCSLSRLGFTDCSSVWNSTGTKTTEIITSGMSIGDDLWAVISCSTTGTAPAFRAGINDDLGSGNWQVSTVAYQLSNSSTLTASTDSSLSQIWIAWQGII